MANKYDLVNVVVSAHGSDVYNIGGAVPSGKTRFLTYIRISKRDISPVAATIASGCTGIVCCEAQTAVDLTYCQCSNIKLPLMLHGCYSSDQQGTRALPDVVLENSIPKRPNMDNPIIAVTGGAATVAMVVALNSGPTCRIFAQYYDAPP